MKLILNLTSTMQLPVTEAGLLVIAGVAIVLYVTVKATK